MLSWVTDGVDGWYQYLQEKSVDIIQPPEDNQEAGIRGMIFKDQGGYTLELCQWTDKSNRHVSVYSIQRSLSRSFQNSIFIPLWMKTSM